MCWCSECGQFPLDAGGQTRAPKPAIGDGFVVVDAVDGMRITISATCVAKGAPKKLLTSTTKPPRFGLLRRWITDARCDARTVGSDGHFGPVDARAAGGKLRWRHSNHGHRAGGAWVRCNEESCVGKRRTADHRHCQGAVEREGKKCKSHVRRNVSGFLLLTFGRSFFAAHETDRRQESAWPQFRGESTDALYHRHVCEILRLRSHIFAAVNALEGVVNASKIDSSLSYYDNIES